MKNILLKKVVIISSALSVSLFSLYADKLDLFKNFNVVEDARERIESTLNNDGTKPYIVKLNYKVSKDKVVVTKKVHYSEYRKKPAYEEEVLKTNTANPRDIDTKIEFTYNRKNDPDHISQLNKEAKKSEPKFTKIALRSSTNDDLEKTILNA